MSSVVDCCADGYNLANPPSVNHAFHINWTAAYGGSGRPVCPVLRAVGCCVPAVTCCLVSVVCIYVVRSHTVGEAVAG